MARNLSYLSTPNGIYVFDTQTLEDSFEKSITRHEFPYRDGGLLEDMGQKTRVSKIRCYFLNENYESHKALINDLSGGTDDEYALMHPEYGLIKGKVESVVVRHDEREETAEIDLVFLENLRDLLDPTRQTSVDAETEEAFTDGQDELAQEMASDMEADASADDPSFLDKAIDTGKELVGQFNGFSKNIRSYVKKVDSYVKMLDRTLNQIENPANSLIATINYAENLKKKKATSTGGGLFGAAQAFAKIEPGQTIFEVLKIYAASRGAMFFTLPDGTFVFGKPKDSGVPIYHFTCRKSDPGQNNVLEGSLDENIAKRYSKVIVIGQQQGQDLFGTGGAGKINSPKAVITDPTFPFYPDFNKPYVAVDQNDSRSPKLHAQMILEKMKYEGFKLQYKVPYHSQNANNFRINEMCHVTDEVLELDDDFLIYGRTFEMSKQGSFTNLRLGYPGIIQ